MQKIRLAYDVQNDSIVDGPGIRTVIWTQGCSHNCKGCHNPETHSFDAGKIVNIETVKKEIKKYSYNDGITFSGGDPMFQVEACLELAKYAKSLGQNVWCYTGFTFEQLLKMCETNKVYLEFLREIDTLVDGKFELKNRNLSLLYKGSTNQRVLDVKSSLELKKAIIDERYNSKQDIMYHTPTGIFI